MARQRLTIGTFGDIGYFSGPSGRVVARARYRDWDGKNRLVQATGDTRKQAERALKVKLADRSLFQPAASDLSPGSPFPDLMAYWLEDLELEGRISKRTRQTVRAEHADPRAAGAPPGWLSRCLSRAGGRLQSSQARWCEAGSTQLRSRLSRASAGKVQRLERCR